LKVTFKISQGDASAGEGRTTLAHLRRGRAATVVSVGGERPFRRRLMEMGLVPGTVVSVVNVAPLGDPIEIDLRHGRMSIRRHEASLVSVRP
jgi:Fe2+ transport system protein FeoA